MLTPSIRRRFPRAPIQSAATCVVGPTRLTCTVWQIGEGGLFIDVVPAAAELGPMSIHFELPGAGGQRVVAEAAWKIDRPTKFAPKAPGGVGVKFSDITPTTRKAIAAYVVKMKKAYESLQFALALNRPTPQLAALLRETGLSSITDPRELKDHVAQAIAHFRAASA